MAPLHRYSAWAVLSLLLLSTVQAADRSKRRLHRFVSHFEPVQYDHGVLMNEHHRVRRTVHGEKEIKLQFTALGRDFNLLLKPDSGEVFHEKMKVTYDGVEYPKSEAKANMYTGVDLNEPGSKAFGNVAFGVFDGFIRTRDDMYVIEPADRFPHADSDGAHSVIYRHSDMDNSELGKSRTCGAVDRGSQRWLANQQQSHHSGRVRRQSDCTNSRNPLKVRCWLHVIADDTFYQATSSGSNIAARMSQVIAVAATAIRGSSVIYEMTDFDGILSMGSADPDNIQFGIENFVVNVTVPSTSDFARQFLGVEAYLRSHSEANWESQCLSYAFTARDFDNGVLGLAFVASSGRSGGICSPFDENQGRTLNTGLVTITNFGSRVPSLVTMLTFAHEAGHNFGSEHDPNTAECSPTSGGNYIMFASASSGNEPNNRRFSPCSRRMMGGILVDAGQDAGCGCFREADDLCGNGIVDEGEQCDCRSSEVNGATMLCNNDPCCNGTSCMIATGRECSPQQGPCCNSSCSFIPEVDEFECRADSECALNQTCNGTSFACPVSDPRVPDNGTQISCKNGDNVCVDGECTGTICIPLNRTDCECTEPQLQCHVCCREQNGTCVSTVLLTQEQPALKDLLPNAQGATVRVGFPCNNFTGYCDFFNRCRIINSDGALRRIANAIFSSEIFMSAIQWIMTYWWGVALMGLGVLVILFLIVLGCHFLLPRPKHMKRRAEERRKKRDERRRAKEAGMPQEYPMQGGNFRS